MSALDELLEMDASIEPNPIEEPEYHELVKQAAAELAELRKKVEILECDYANLQAWVEANSGTWEKQNAALEEAREAMEIIDRFCKKKKTPTPAHVAAWLTMHPK